MSFFLGGALVFRPAPLGSSVFAGMVGSPGLGSPEWQMSFVFEDFALDCDRRELRRGTALVTVEPKVFDLLAYLIRNRDRVVSRDDLIAAVWDGRIVSESALATCINAARSAIGDSGEAQRLIKTLPRRGIRFVGDVREPQHAAWALTADVASAAPLALPDKP